MTASGIQSCTGNPVVVVDAPPGQIVAVVVIDPGYFLSDDLKARAVIYSH